MLAAYIDLNAVRTGMVKDSKDYRWCGYGEAVANYRLLIYAAGTEQGVAENGDMAAKVVRVVRERGERSIQQILRCHVRCSAKAWHSAAGRL